MKKSKQVSGLRKLLFYLRMSIGTALHYLPRMRRIGGLGVCLRMLRTSGKFTSVFFRHKLLHLPDGTWKLDFYMPAYPAPAFFRALEDKTLCRPPRPVSAVFSMTKACSYHCPHCYQRLDGNADMPEERMLEIAGEMRDFGVCAYAVEGGEPFLRFERLMNLLDVLKGCEVWVNSTGFGADAEKIRRLKEAGVTGVMSSVHAVDEAEHDAFTGVPGSQKTAFALLAECRRAGMLTGFNTVLSDDAVLDGGIDRIMALAGRLDCDYIQLIHPKRAGLWLNHRFQEHSRAAELTRRAQIHYNSGAARGYPILTAQVFEEAPDMLGCTCGGIDRFYLNASGELQPCEFVNLSFGNLNEIPFREAYERMRAVFRRPCCEWVCAQHAEEIAEAFRRSGVTETPLPWKYTEPLVKNWRCGTPTPVYERMGIYR